MKQYFFIILLVCCTMNGHTQIAIEGKWRFNLSGGMGYRTINTSEDESKLTDMGFSAQKAKDCYTDLKWGIQGNADIHYLFHPNFGIGLKYAFFNANGMFDEYFSYTIPQTSIYGILSLKMDEKDYLNYIGPSLHARSFLGKSKFAVSGTLSGGYTHYRSDYESALITVQKHLHDSFGIIVEEPNGTQMYETHEQFIMRGNSFGIYASAGLEYFFNKRIALGFDLGYFHSSLNDVKINHTMIKLKDVTGKEENLSRIDFSLGIKIYL